MVKIEATLGGDYDGEEGVIWMTCSTAKPQIEGFVTADRFVSMYRAGPPEAVEITYAVRFDDDKPITGSITGVRGQNIIKMDRPFVYRLAGSKKLAYRINDSTVVFDTTGAETAIDQLSETCNRG